MNLNEYYRNHKHAINASITLDLHLGGGKIGKDKFVMPRKEAGSAPVSIKENISFISISGLPACLNPGPNSRLTSIVKVIRLSSRPFR